MTRAILIAILLGIGTLLFCVLFLHQCSVSNDKQKFIEKLDKSKTDTVNVLGGKVSAYKDTVSALKTIVSDKNSQLKDKDSQILAGEKKAAEVKSDLLDAVAKRNAAIATMNEKDRRIAALKLAVQSGDLNYARLKDTLDNMPIFSDAEANQIYLKVKGENEELKKVNKEIATQLGQKDEKIKQQDSQISGLEAELLNLKPAVKATIQEAENQWLKEATTKRFLGGGRKKNARERANYYHTKQEVLKL